MALTDVIIRFADARDAPDIARIHTESWRRHYRGMYADSYLDGDLYADRLAAWTEKMGRDPLHYFTLIAEDGTNAIGFAHIALDADPKWGTLVDNLHVSHSAQGKGVGSRLLEQVARQVVERRPGTGIYLWVLELNESATAFYVSRGGSLRDSELSSPPGNDPRNLHGSPRRIRVAWEDPRSLFISS